MNSATKSLTKSGTFFYPEAISTYASQADTLYYFIYYLSIIFFIGLIIGSTLLIRSSLKDNTNKKHVIHNHILEAVWTIIPAILVGVIFYWGTKDYIKTHVAPGNAMEIHVLGEKWQWRFQYPNGTTTLNELVVPLNRPVKLIMSSKDVLHSLFIPNLRVKRDLIPNKYTSLWFNANKLGRYQIFCTEYCGDAHSNMLAVLDVRPQAAFESWLESGGGADKNISLPELGKKLFTAKGCNACHSLDGSEMIGPTWKGLYGKKRAFTNGQSELAKENYLREAIVLPQKTIVVGYSPVMPSYKGLLKDRDLAGIIEYIKSLK